MKIKVLKRRGIAEMVEVRREQTLEEIVEENERLAKKIDNQFNSILTEIKINNRILREKLADEER